MRTSFKTHLLLSISYDGSSYFGWAKQNNRPLTIQQVLETSLFKVIKTNDFKTLGASKTDAKVHAQDQKVLLMINFLPKNLSYFQQAINEVLPDDILVKHLEVVDKNFNVRQVKQKIYEYVINDTTLDIFNQRFEIFSKQSIDETQLQNIFNLFIGTHDFYLFSGLSNQEKTLFKTIRTIDEIIVKRIGNKIIIQFKAPSFIRYQIRMVIGTALKMYFAPEKITSHQIQEKLQGIGTKFPYLISGKGLILKKIIY